MKRIVTFSVETDGRKRVQSISAPVDETKIDTLSENMGFIDSGYLDPAPVEGKKVSTKGLEEDFQPIKMNNSVPDPYNINVTVIIPPPVPSDFEPKKEFKKDTKKKTKKKKTAKEQ